MTQFVQLHFLTAYPPSNPNRDDMNRPKTAIYGGVQRLRLSSQSLKRAVRLSDAMSEALAGNNSLRTRQFGEVLVSHLLSQGAERERARSIAAQIVEVFGQLDRRAIRAKPTLVHSRQLAFISPEERSAAIKVADRVHAGDDIEDATKPLAKTILRTADGAVDLAMFGRMLADAPEFNREAAVQVSHAITTHRADPEEDFFSAVDDLKQPSGGSASAFLGESGFGSGVYYLYVCIDVDLLIRNLAHDRSLARMALAALPEAFATATPSGKSNSYAHQTVSFYVRAESGDRQPRSLAAAFLHPVDSDDLIGASIERLRDTAAMIDEAYGPRADDVAEMDVLRRQGSLAAIRNFLTERTADA